MPHSIDSTVSKHAAAVSKKQAVFINELLCFVNNHFHSRASEVIKATVCNFYSNTEVEAAKLLLFQVYKSPSLSTKRHKKDKGVDDILSFLKESDKLENKESVLFLAKDLSRIPSFLEEDRSSDSVSSPYRSHRT